jgi:excisionase family DNA binding protein
MLKTRAGEVVGAAAPPHKATLTVDEVGQALGISRNPAYSAVNAGEIPAIRIGRRWLVPKAAFERLLEAERKPAPIEAA